MLEFEWDEEKNRSNRAKHDIDFDTAIWVFQDIHAFEQEDRSMNYDELRLKITGITGDRFVTVIYTERADRYRIISARKANSSERYDYEKNRR